MGSARFVGGLGVKPPSGASQPSKLALLPLKLGKQSKKYIADPLWFYHKSTSVWWESFN